MLKGTVSIFEGLESDLASARAPQSLHDTGNGTHNTCNRGWCGSWQALLLSNSGELPTVTELSARPPETDHKQAAEHIDSSAYGIQLIYHLYTNCSPWQRPHSIHQDAVLLQVYYQSSTQTACGEASSDGRHTVPMSLPCSTPCWLALYKSGKHLQLYGVSEHKQRQQHSTHFLLELQHDSFRRLQPHQCWLLEGPVIILQVQQEQLLLLTSAAAQAAPASADVVSSVAPDSNCPAGTPHAVMQLELDLPSNDIFDCLDQVFMQQLIEMSPAAAAAVPVLQLVADRHTSCRHLTAIQPWRLLHCHATAASAQLLLGMQAAVAPGKVWNCHHSHQHQQQQQQEKLSLLVWLEVRNVAAAAADMAGTPSVAAASGANSSDVEVLHCWSTGWPDAPTFAAMRHDQQQCQQLIAIASSTGALELLSCSLQQPTQQQPSMHQLAPGHRSINPLLQASGSVPGAPDSIHLLPQVAAGRVHRNVVCVLHALSRSNSSSVTTTSKCVTLLVQQGDELQAIAQVPDATAVLVPGHSAPLGLLCPWQQQQQQQHQQREGPELHQAKAADDRALQLAALILQAEPAANHADQQVIGLHCYAKLDGSSETPAVPAASGLLQHMPPVLQQWKQQGETAASHAAKAAASNELRSLRTMVAALEARWQQEFLDLAALQQKFTQGRRSAAAAHRQLCQLAADTIQNSSIRQYSSPLTQLDATAALKAYQVGRSILQEQLQGCRQQRSNLGGLIDCQLQLTVELISCRSQLLEDRLQLTVQVKPVLSMQQQQAEGRGVSSSTSINTSTGHGGSSSWWGPLLQPCHAEVLMWHADVSLLTSQSSWHWDAVEGVVTLQAEVPAAALLHAASGAFITSTGSAVEHKQSSVMGQHTADINADEYVGVARSVAAAVTASLNAAVVTRDARCSTAHTSSKSRFAAESCNSSSASTVQLYAAVAVAACCSKQAVAYEQSNQPNTTQNLSRAAEIYNCSHVEESIMLRAQLLTPATALIHLPAVTVSIQQLLLQQLAPAAPQTAFMLHQQQPAAVADRKAGLHTPLQAKPGQQQQHQGQVTPLGAGIPCSELQPMLTGFTNTDVIPPTPCEDDMGGVSQGVADGYPQELVVADSQPEDEQQLGQDHLMQHDHTMTAAADNPAAVILAVGTPTKAEQHCQLLDAGAPADENQQRAQLHQSMLLLQGPAATLQQVPVVLVQRLGFRVAAAGLPAGSASDLAAMQQLQLQRLVAALQGLGRQQTGLVHIKLQHDAASTGGSCSRPDVMQLVWFSSELLHVELMASSSNRLHILQQLLQLAINSITESGSVKCQLSPLSAQRHASYLAATNTLTETVHLHCKLIEETLQQVHQQQQQQRHGKSDVAAAQSGVNNVIAARGDAVAGVKRPAADGLGAPAATDSPPDVVGSDAADGSVLYVDGLCMKQALSSCWVSLYESQADVDLAMSQLQLAGE